MKTTKFKWSRDQDGEWLSIQTDGAMEFLKTIEDGKTYEVSIKEWHPKRSLSANAYFHLLCNEIANKTNTKADLIKKQLVLDYGTIAKEDGQVMGCQLPINANPDIYYPYCKWYKDTESNGKKYSCYLFYKQTHLMDSKEMAHLIDGTIQEAKELGIETLTPGELALLKEN